MAMELPWGAKLVLYALGAAFAALPVLTALSLWQTVSHEQRGDEPLSRSWADATRSFLGMTLSSWLLVGLSVWTYHGLLHWWMDARGR